MQADSQLNSLQGRLGPLYAKSYINSAVLGGSVHSKSICHGKSELESELESVGRLLPTTEQGRNSACHDEAASVPPQLCTYAPVAHFDGFAESLPQPQLGVEVCVRRVVCVLLAPCVQLSPVLWVHPSALLPIGRP